MGEAIRNAGTLNMPPDDEGFLAFVRGPFARAAVSVLDAASAQSIVDEVVAKIEAAASKVRTLPLGSEDEGVSLAARLEARLAAKEAQDAANKESTLPYGAPAAKPVVDPITMVMVEPDSGFRGALSELLAARGHGVLHAEGVKQVAALVGEHAVGVVIANLDPGGYSFAGDLRIALGRATPQLVLLGGTLTLHAPRPGVALVLPKQLDLSVAEAIEELVGGE